MLISTEKDPLYWVDIRNDTRNLIGCKTDTKKLFGGRQQLIYTPIQEIIKFRIGSLVRLVLSAEMQN